MSEIEGIRDQLKRGHQGEAWHGPSVLEALEGVSAEQATARPLDGAHTIWELVLHMAAWRNVARRRLEGERVDSIPDEEDFPIVFNPGADAWNQALAQLDETFARLDETLSRFETVADQDGSFLFCGIPAGMRLYAGAIDPSAEPSRRSNITYFTTPRGIHTAKLEITPEPEVSEGS